MRQGKRFELEVEGEVTVGAARAQLHEIAGKLLSNPVIEDLVDGVRCRASGSPVRVGVVTFPGSPRRPRRPRAPSAWPAPTPSRSGTASTILRGVDAVVLPGGFSYGDYLRCGAIARFSPLMTEVIRLRRPELAACPCSASATASRSCARRTYCPAR